MLPEQVATKEELEALEVEGVLPGALVWVGDYPTHGEMYVLTDAGSWRREEKFHAVSITIEGPRAMCGADKPVFGTTITCAACIDKIQRVCDGDMSAVEIPKPPEKESEENADAARVHNRGIPESQVNSPIHYNTHPVCEAVDVIEHMSHNVGAAVKYLWRAGLKTSAPKKEDLEKARWYLARERARYHELQTLNLDDRDVLPSLTPNIVKLVVAVARHPSTSRVLSRVLAELSHCGVAGTSIGHLKDYMGRAVDVVQEELEIPEREAATR